MFRLLRGNNKSRSAAAATIDYLESGEILLRNLEEIFRDIGYSFRHVNSFLDFACGHGRLTRFLVRKLEPSKITGSDISEEGVDLTCRTFGVKGFYSTGQPGRLAHDGPSTWNDWQGLATQIELGEVEIADVVELVGLRELDPPSRPKSADLACSV